MKNHKHLFLILVSLTSIQAIFPMYNEFAHNLCKQEDADQCDDTQRWITLSSSDFMQLFMHADQEKNIDKRHFKELKEKIKKNQIQISNHAVMLTQKELFAGLLASIPWTEALLGNPSNYVILLNSKPKLLILGQNFWNPNQIAIVPTLSTDENNQLAENFNNALR